MPELTVSMPAYNSEKFIKQSIQSVLRQEGIDFELIVIDDCSSDHTVEVVSSIKDSRLKLLRNIKNRGISYCHNLVIKNSAAPYLSHVDSDDTVLPGALNKMINCLKANPDAGQAHCYFYFVNDRGEIVNHKSNDYFKKYITQDMDYKKELLIRGSVMNALRTYRRNALDAVGYFNESIRCGEDYEMGLRIIDKFKIVLVPEFLYCARMHGKNTSSYGLFREFIWWWQTTRVCFDLFRNNKLNFLKENKYNIYKMKCLSLAWFFYVKCKRII